MFRKPSSNIAHNDASYTFVTEEAQTYEKTQASDNTGGRDRIRKGTTTDKATTSVTFESENSLSPLINTHEKLYHENTNVVEDRKEQNCENKGGNKNNLSAIYETDPDDNKNQDTNFEVSQDKSQQSDTLAPSQRGELIDGVELVVAALESGFA